MLPYSRSDSMPCTAIRHTNSRRRLTKGSHLRKLRIVTFGSYALLHLSWGLYEILGDTSSRPTTRTTSIPLGGRSSHLSISWPPRNRKTYSSCPMNASSGEIVLAPAPCALVLPPISLFSSRMTPIISRSQSLCYLDKTVHYHL